MRIAMLSLHSNPLGRLGTRATGGMSVYLVELAGCLAAAGHRVDIFTASSDYDSFTPVDLGKGVRLLPLPPPAGEKGPGPWASMREGLAAPDAMARQILARSESEVGRYDLVHSNYWVSGQVGGILCRRWSCPHIVSYHTLAIAKKAALAGHVELHDRAHWERRLLAEADLVLAPTRAERKRMVEEMGGEKERITLLGCGVNTRLFAPSKQPVERDENRPRRLLYVGRFDPMKGLDDLLKSLASLPPSLPFRLELVGGDGPQSKEHRRLEKLCESLGLARKTRFAGPLPQNLLVERYRQNDVVVVPSRYESFGLVALEALACGTPVAATRVGVMEEVIVEGHNGALAEKGESGLAEAISRAMALSRHGDGKEIARSVAAWDWRLVAERLVDVYRKSIVKKISTGRR